MRPGRWSGSRRATVRQRRAIGALYVLVGVLWIIGGVVGQPDNLDVLLGVGWLAGAAVWFGIARADRRREQRGYYDHELPVPTPEVLTLAGQGRKIKAIRRYRKQNPGTWLKDAKDVIDGL